MDNVTVNDLNFRDKNVLKTVDFNVSLDETQKMTNDKRIVEFLSTIHSNDEPNTTNRLIDM